jgi:hypothetical protein
MKSHSQIGEDIVQRRNLGFEDWKSRELDVFASCSGLSPLLIGLAGQPMTTSVCSSASVDLKDQPPPTRHQVLQVANVVPSLEYYPSTGQIEIAHKAEDTIALRATDLTNRGCKSKAQHFLANTTIRLAMTRLQ